MKTHVASSEIVPLEWISINQFLHEIKQIDSQCITVYYPYGKGQETISLLHETKRNDALEKIELKIENKITELKKNPVYVDKSTKNHYIFGWIKKRKINHTI